MVHSALGKLSRVVKLDLTYYLTGGFWLTFANVVAILFNLLLSVLFARFTSKGFYGQYKFAQSIFSLLAIVTLPGMNTAIQQSVAKGYSWSLIRGVKEKLKWSLLAWPILAAVAVYFILLEDNPLGWAFLIAMPLFSLNYGFANGAFFTGRKRFRATSLINVAQRIFLVGLVASAVLLFENVIAAVLAFLLAYAVLNLGVFLYIKREIQDAPDQRDDTELISYGKHLTAMDILSSTVTELDSLLLAYFLGFQEVAIYGIARNIPGVVKGLHKQISSLTLPRLAITRTAKVHLKIRTKLGHLLVVGGIPTVVLIVVLPIFIPIVYSPKYAASTLPAVILAISIVLNPLKEVLVSALTSHKRTRELYYFKMLSPGARIVLLVLLIPLFGVLGAALSLLLARWLGVVYAWHAVKKMSLEDTAVEWRADYP